MPIPNVPTNVLVSPGNGRVYVSWSPQVGATSASTGVGAASTGAYDVMRSFDGVNFHLLTSINNLEHFDSPSTGMLLHYAVIANGNNGQSARSAAIVTTVVNEGQTTLGAVRLAAQQRADMVNSDFISKQEWNDYINKSYARLYDILIQTYADDYYVATPFSVSTDSRNPPLYNLPSNFYKLLGVDLAINGTDTWATITKHAFAHRNRYQYNFQNSVIGAQRIKYRLVGNQINLIGAGNSRTLRLWYIPRPTTLQADYHVLDGISGWEEYVILDVAIKALGKEESDASLLLAKQAEIKQQIDAAAANRDPGMAEMVTDVRRYEDDGSGGGFGWEGEW